MKRKVIFLTLCLLCMFIGCGKQPVAKPSTIIPTNIPDHHSQYLESFGWHIEHMDNQSDRYVRYSAGPEWEPYWGKEVQVTTYVLKEQQVNGGKVYASITEYEGEIIAGSGSSFSY